MRLIDGDNVKENLYQMLIDELGDTDYVDGLRQGIEMAIEVIDEHITVDAEPIRHGHWEKSKDDNDRWRCSHCGWVFIGFNGMHTTFAEMCDYCPCCGTRMDEVEE